MEKFPGTQTNKSEEQLEKILSNEEVLRVLSEHVEGYVVSRELSDEKGLYLLEVETKGNGEGEITEFQYMRKGRHSNHNEEEFTVINVIYYEHGMAVHGERIALFDEHTGEWVKL